MDRHNGKHLADRPVIQYGLENREVAKILVSKLFLHGDQVLGKQLRISLLQHPVDRRAYRPIESFSGSLLFQRKISQLEQQPNLLPLLCGVVERFQQHGQGFPPYRLVCNRIERSEEHTSELQSLAYLVCRLLLEKKKKKYTNDNLRI